jgi:hypothetical protein
MRTSKILGLVLGGMLLLSALAMVATPVLANGNGAGNGNGTGSEGSGEQSSNSSDGVNAGTYQKASGNSLLGKMGYSYGHGEGGFVFYDLDEDTGIISDYGLNTSYGEKVLISNITVDGFVPDSVITTGSVAKLVDDDTMVMVHDNPTGMYHLFVNGSANVTIVLAGDMVVTEQRTLNESCDMTYQLVISDGNVTGMIASEDPFMVTENGTVIGCTVTEDLMVRFIPQTAHRYQWLETALMYAVQNGSVGAEVTVMADDGESVYDVMCYRNELQVQVQKVAQNKLQMSVGGQNQQGCLLLINTDAGTMDMTQQRLRVCLDGTEISEADDALEMMYGQSDKACYIIVEDEGVQQMLVYLPADTVGAITVEGVDELSELFSPISLAMMIGAVGLVAVAGIVVFRKR